MYPTYPLIECVFYLEKLIWWHSAKRTNDLYVSKKNLQKKNGVNVLTLC